MVRTKTGWRSTRISAVMFMTIALWSCSDDPSVLNSVGSQLHPSNTVIKTDTLHAASSATFKQYVPMNGRTDLVGRFNGYNAYTLLQFSSLAQRDTVLVTSATINVQAVTWFGDSSAIFRFDIYEMNRSWVPATFQWDSVTGSYNSASHTTFAGTIEKDTQTVSMKLDTAMVRRWLQSATAANNHGVILIPDITTNVVRGINQFTVGGDSIWPTLTIVARNIAGTVTDTTSYKIGQGTFVGDVTLAPGSTLYAQSGVVYRSRLIFDCSPIPRGAIINQADLVLTYNPAASRLNKFTSDSAVAVHASLDATDSSKFNALSTRIAGSLATSDKFHGDIRGSVQTWIRDQSHNYGLILRSTNNSEFSSFDLFAFYNQAIADPTKRPQLIVRYTMESN